MSAINGRRGEGGFSLIELMIALVVGLIVLGAVLTFTVSTIRSYSENIRSTRLTQDLRTSMNVVVRELRRAGFDSSSVSRVLTDENPSGFSRMVVTGQCVSYEYDRGVAGVAPAATEIRSVRLNTGTGAVQLNATDATMGCGGSAWVDVSDPAIVEVTKFTPVIVNSAFCSDLGNKIDPVTLATVYEKAEGSVRNLSLCLQGRLRSDNTITRHVANTTRVRAEDVRFFMDATSACGTATAGTLPTPSELNNTCATP